MTARKPIAVLESDVCCPTIREAPLTEHDASELARSFAALADPARLRILSLLASAERGEVWLRPGRAGRPLPANRLTPPQGADGGRPHRR